MTTALARMALRARTPLSSVRPVTPPLFAGAQPADPGASIWNEPAPPAHRDAPPASDRSRAGGEPAPARPADATPSPAVQPPRRGMASAERAGTSSPEEGPRDQTPAPERPDASRPPAAGPPEMAPGAPPEAPASASARPPATAAGVRAFIAPRATEPDRRRGRLAATAPERPPASPAPPEVTISIGHIDVRAAPPAPAPAPAPRAATTHVTLASFLADRQARP